MTDQHPVPSAFAPGPPKQDPPRLIDRGGVPEIIALLLVVAVVALTFVLAFRDPGGDMFKFMVGGLMTTGFAAIVGFYFGSSAGSKAKDDALINR